MLSFIDVSGHSIDNFYILSTKGEPGEWSGIIKYHKGKWTLLKEFPDEWVVSIDTFGKDGVVAVTDDGLFYQYFNGLWHELDTLMIHGLINVKSFGYDNSFISGANGYFAHIQQGKIDKISVNSSLKIMGIYGKKENDISLVGDKGLFIKLVNGRVVKEKISDDMLCDFTQDNLGKSIAVGSNGKIISRENNGTWSVMHSGVSWPLTEICMVRDSLFYAVGGGILKIENDKSSIEVDSDDFTFICAITQFESGGTIAVGESEMILVGPGWKPLKFNL